MNENVLSYCEPVVILGGGTLGKDDLALALSHAKRVIAADGGANAAYAEGLKLDAIYGDMDSIDPRVAAQADHSRFFHIAEQDSTDFDKALRHVETPCVIAVGFAGGRMDHQMGALHTMVARAHQPCLLLAAEDVVFLCPPRLLLDLAAGERFSLFPLGPVTGRSRGLEWPIEGLEFLPGVRSGTSNRALGPVELEVDAPAMLCFLPRGCFALALKALVALRPPHGRWPSRAG
ncbi:MAG: thiamine diphosphokinase [Pseudomonadota bacterium]